MSHLTFEQGTDAWRSARAGRATASRFADVMATVKSGEAADRRNYRAQLVCEALTGKPMDAFATPAMRTGIEREPIARARYEAETGVIVERCGFFTIDGVRAGASPDGLIGVDGVLEIKCPNAATHIDYLRLPAGKPPRAYVWQIQGEMLATGRAWCDFVSYHPDFPEPLQLTIRRVLRDDDAIARLVDELKRFIADVDAEVSELQALATSI